MTSFVTSLWTPRLKILVFTQACASCLIPGLMLIAGLFGPQIAPDIKFSSLPLSFLILGLALCGPIAASTMKRIGRKKAHQLGLVVSLVGIVLCGSAIQASVFWFYCLAHFIAGAGISFNQQIRFTAAEENSDRKGEIHSVILGATLISAFCGPGAAVLGRSLFPIEFVGSVFLLFILCLLALLATFFLPTMPAAIEAKAIGGESLIPRTFLNFDRSYFSILNTSRFWKGTFTGIVSFATMSLVMAATPIQMHHVDHFSHSSTTLAIQSHIFAMYFPSAFGPYLIRRWQLRNIIALGVVVLLVSLMTGFLGHEFINFWFTMVLLGIGWNFLFLCSSTWISTQFTGPDRFFVQGTNDFLVFGTQALAGGLAGPLVLLLGWEWVLWIPIPLLLGLFYLHFRKTA